MQIDLKAIEAAIVERVATEIMDSGTVLENTIKEARSRVNQMFGERVESEIVKIVAEAVKAGFEVAYQPVNKWGNPEGEPVKIKDRLAKIIEDYWSGRVSSKTGEPTSDSYGSVSRAEWMMMQVCGKDFSEHMKAAVVNASAQLKDGLRAQLRANTDKLLGEIFRVVSKNDKEEGRRNG